MGSFADRQPTTFNPYVKQLPTEEMSMVGMELQRRYDQGVQRIQATIDRIGGLDVANDADKAYLQSKLNGLSDKLMLFSGADFSKFQLTNSVAGMAADVAKDENVMNAVMSTANYRKQEEAITKATEKGTASPSNIYHFRKRAEQWMSSTTPGQKFNDKYVDYFDVDKHVKDTFNSLKPDGYTTESLWQTDEKGNPIKEQYIDPTTGETKERYVLSPTMTRLKKEGMFPKKVQEALDHIFSDPRVSQQLQIDGEYQMKNHPPEILARSLSNKQQDVSKKYTDRIGELNIQLNATTDQKEREKIQSEIDTYKGYVTNIDSYYDKLRASLSTNPDFVRGILHTESQKDVYTGMYTNVKEEMTNHENPMWRAQFDMQKEANDMRYKWASLKQSDDHFKSNYALAKKRLEIDALRAITSGRRGRGVIGEDGEFEGRVEPPTPEANSSEIDAVTIFDETVASAAGNFQIATDELLYESGVMSNENAVYYKNKFGITLNEARRVLIEAQARREGISVDEFRTKWYVKAMQTLNSNPSKNSPVIAAVKENAEVAKKDYEYWSGQKKKYDVEFPIPESVRDFKNLGTITIKGATLGPTAQYHLAVFTAGDKPLASDELKRRSVSSKKWLESNGFSIADLKEYTKIRSQRPYQEHVKTTWSLSEQELNKDDYKFQQLVTEMENNPAFVEMIDKRAAKLKEEMVTYPTLGEAVFTGHTATDKLYKEQISNLIHRYQLAGMNESPNFMDNIPDIAKALDEGTVKIVYNKDNISETITPKLIFINKDQSIAGELNITEAEAFPIVGDVRPFYSDNKTKAIEMQLKQTGNNSTSYGDVQELDTYTSNDVALFKRDMPQLNGAISADVKCNFKFAAGQYYTYVYVNDGENKFVKVFSTPKPDLASAIATARNINPAIINQLISENSQK